MQLSLFTVPMTCDPLVNQPITACAEMYRHLASLNLADDYMYQVRLSVASGPMWSTEQDQSSVIFVSTHVLRVDSRQRDLKGLDNPLESLSPWASVAQRRLCTRRLVTPSGFMAGATKCHCLGRKVTNISPRQHNKSMLHSRSDQEGRGTTCDRVQPNWQLSKLPTAPCCHWNGKMTLKMRIVYDPSSKLGGPFLNECCLYTGPNFNQRIMDIVLRICSYLVALMAEKLWVIQS